VYAFVASGFTGAGSACLTDADGVGLAVGFGFFVLVADGLALAVADAVSLTDTEAEGVASADFLLFEQEVTETAITAPRLSTKNFLLTLGELFNILFPLPLKFIQAFLNHTSSILNLLVD